MNTFGKLALLLGLALTAAGAATAATGGGEAVVGHWRSIDDATGKPKSVVEISAHEGKLQGHVRQLFREPGEDPNPLCTACSGALKDAPIIGLKIIDGAAADDEEFGGGSILDPKTGKVYRLKLSLEDGGQRLRVRGYLGLPALGRTQIWERLPDPAVN